MAPKRLNQHLNDVCALRNIFGEQNVHLKNALLPRMRRVHLDEFCAGSDKLYVTVEETRLWSQLFESFNEMVVTNAGRSMFPKLQINVTGLQAKSLYVVCLEFIQLDHFRMRFMYRGWERVLPLQSDAAPYSLLVHCKGHQSGSYWMANAISFSSVKISNIQPSNPPIMALNSMYRYVPRVHFLRCVRSHAGAVFPVNVTSQDLTICQFLATTAYQNEGVSRIKSALNPYSRTYRSHCSPAHSLDHSHPRAHRRTQTHRSYQKGENLDGQERSFVRPAATTGQNTSAAGSPDTRDANCASHEALQERLWYQSPLRCAISLSSEYQGSHQPPTFQDRSTTRCSLNTRCGDENLVDAGGWECDVPTEVCKQQIATLQQGASESARMCTQCGTQPLTDEGLHRNKSRSSDTPSSSMLEITNTTTLTKSTSDLVVDCNCMCDLSQLDTSEKAVPNLDRLAAQTMTLPNLSFVASPDEVVEIINGCAH